MSDSTLSALSNIRTKVRRLTRNPSTSQLSNADLDNYINSFILYDMPAHIKLDSLKTTLTFYTKPNEEKYSTSVTVTDPLYNFKNKYTNIQSPIYIAGDKASFSQSRDEFYGIYPLTETRVNIGTGDGVTTNFTGELSNVPILPGHVTISSLDDFEFRIMMNDDGTGFFTGDSTPLSNISYSEGSYDITFTTAPGNGEALYVSTVPYTASKPNSILFVENEFTLRPVPDGTYSVSVTVLQRPTEMADAADLPELSEWWSYISYGAAIKVLQDRLDMDTIQLLMPEFKNQEILIGRRKIVQNSGKRAATIFTSGYTYNSDFIGDK